MATIKQTLQALNTYPVLDVILDAFLLDRGLTGTNEYSQSVGASQSFRLATADVYDWLSTHPDIVEQKAGINNAISIKRDLAKKANGIYKEFDDPKFRGKTYGFLGENWNG